MANFFDQFDAQPAGGAFAPPPGAINALGHQYVKVQPPDGGPPVYQLVTTPGGSDQAPQAQAGQAAPAQPASPGQTGNFFDQFDNAPQEASGPPNPMEGQGSFMDSAINGLTFGFGDEAAGALAGAGSWLTGGSFNDAYDRTTENIRNSLRDYETRHPYLAAAGNIAGGVASIPLMPEMALLKAGANAGRAARIAAPLVNAGIQGAVAGGLQGYGNGSGGVGNRLEDAATGAALGGAIGAPLGAVAGGIANYASRPSARLAAGAPSAVDVAAAGQRLGIPIPLAAASNSMAVQRSAQLLSSVPVIGNPIKRASEKALAGMGEAAGNIAADMGGGSASSVAGAGAGTRAALADYIGPVTKSRVSAAYDAVDKLINKHVTAHLSHTAQTASAILGERAAAALPGPGAAVKLIAEAVQRPGGLTYAGIKQLRTRVGEMLDQSLLPGDMSQGELKRIYGALTEDLRNAARQAGGRRALDAFTWANSLNAAVAKRRAELARLLNVKNDEGIIHAIERMAGSRSSADLKMLAKVKASVPADDWNDIASAVIGRMGRQANGNGDFTAELFIRHYKQLSDQGKALLFGNKPGLRDALDDLATVADRFKSLQKFTNSSKTGDVVTGSALMTLAVSNPFLFVKTVIPSVIMARIFSKPATVRAMTRWASAYHNYVAKPSIGAMQILSASSKRFASEIGQSFGLTPYVDRFALALAGSPRAAAVDNGPPDNGQAQPEK